jgi:hypothetical protein
MRWIAPSEEDFTNRTLRKRLWDSGDQFRANFCAEAQDYPGPIVSIIFLGFAEARAEAITNLEKSFVTFGIFV